MPAKPQRRLTPEEEAQLIAELSAFGPGFDPGMAPNPYPQEEPPKPPAPLRGVDASGNAWGEGVREGYNLPEDDPEQVRDLSRADATWASDDVPLKPGFSHFEEPPEPEEELPEQEQGATLAEPMERDLSKTIGRVASTPQKGDNPDLYGYDDDPSRRARAERMEAAREAYEQVPPSQDSRWEDEFLQNRIRTTDDDVQRAYLLQSLMWGNEQGMKHREMMRREQTGYEEGLDKARGKDAANQRISSGLAQAIAGLGWASPEEAAQLRKGDEMVRAFQNGGYAQFYTSEKLDAGRDKTAITELGKVGRQGTELATRERLAAERGMTDLEVADKYANRKQHEEYTPEEQAAIRVNTLLRSFGRAGLTLSAARAAANGDVSSVPAAIRDDVEAEAASLGALRTKSDLGPLAKQPAIASSKADTAVDTASRVDRAKLATRPDSIKRRDSLIELAAAVDRARRAWREMDPQAQKAWVQFGPKGPDAVKDVAGLKNFQGQVTNLFDLRNTLVRLNSGLAVTDHELKAQLESQGLTPELWNPFKSTEGYEEALRRFKATVMRRRKQMADEGSWPLGTED